MTGLLIVNHFLGSEKFADIYDRLRAAAEAHGVKLQLMTNRALLHAEGEPLPLPFHPDFVLFWDKDVALARELEAAGLSVFNNAAAIEACDDKALMARKLRSFPMPKTIVAPMTFANIGYTDLSFLDEVGEKLSFPLVIKECRGSFGRQVYLAKNREELYDKVKSLGGTPLIFQELIKESFGRDIRVNVVGGKVLCAMVRSSTNGDFRSNITLGGTAHSYSVNEDEAELAISAVKSLGLDFAGVDLLFGKDNEPVLCEVNSNAHFKSTLDYTGVDMADAIISHIIRKLGGVS